MGTSGDTDSRKGSIMLVRIVIYVAERAILCRYLFGSRKGSIMCVSFVKLVAERVVLCGYVL